MSPECKTELNGIDKYLKSFKCTLMATIWLKLLTAIDQKNKILQARNTTLDVEVKNIADLVDEVKKFRDLWDNLLSESRLAAEAMASDLPTETEIPKKELKKEKYFLMKFLKQIPCKSIIMKQTNLKLMYFTNLLILLLVD